MHLPDVISLGKSIEDIVYEAQRKVILEMADRGILCNYRKKCRLYPEGSGMMY